MFVFFWNLVRLLASDNNKKKEKIEKSNSELHEMNLELREVNFGLRETNFLSFSIWASRESRVGLETLKKPEGRETLLSAIFRHIFQKARTL